MQNIQKNNMLIKTILTVFLLFIFFAPASLSLKTYPAHALGPATTLDTSAADTDPVNPPNTIATPGDATQKSENFLSKSASFIGGKIYDYTIGAAIVIIGNIILSLAAAFTWVGGSLLELTLEKLVFGMGNQINSQELGTAIDSIWSLIRDICNLAFIFGFIYVGIYTIIDPEKADTKRFLSQIIIGALLINFSLFFTKIVIDFSNFSSIVIYNAMVESPETSTITGKIVTQLGLTTLYASPGAQVLADIASGKSIWFFILGAIFLLVSAFVFFAASFLLITRFVALVLIMVASPILFAATVFPKTKSYADDLWKKLFSYAFFAPVYLLLTLITIKLMDALGVSSTNDKLVNALTDTSGNAFGVILNFVVIIFFLLSSLTIAKKMGIEGGEMAISAGKDLRQRGQRALGASTAGLAARGGRTLLGGIGNKISEKDSLKDAAAMKGIRGFAARQALKSSRAVGDASFDVRNVAGVGKTLGIGEGRKGGYTTVKKEVQEKEEKFAKSLGEVGDNDVRVQARKQEMEFAEKKYKENIEFQKEKLKNGNPVDRQAAQVEIAKLEKAKENAKIEYEKEKQRRIIGSTYAKPESLEDINEVSAQKAVIQAQKDAIKTRWEGYLTLNSAQEPQKEAQRKIIENLMNDLKKKEDTLSTFLNEKQERGIAGILETSTISKAWPVGRLVGYEKAAGKAMRKTAEKGLPKEKNA